MFTFSTIKILLITPSYNINLRKLPVQHGEVSIMCALAGTNLARIVIFDLTSWLRRREIPGPAFRGTYKHTPQNELRKLTGLKLTCVSFLLFSLISPYR